MPTYSVTVEKIITQEFVVEAADPQEASDRAAKLFEEREAKAGSADATMPTEYVHEFHVNEIVSTKQPVITSIGIEDDVEAGHGG